MSEMQTKLHDYVNGKIDYTPIMNFMMNYHDEDLYENLGRYIVDNLDINQIPSLQFFSKKLPSKTSIITKISNFGRSTNRVYTSIAIMFLTATLDEKSLTKMFGSPLKHSEFGEGFDPKRKYSYVSYFASIGGHDFHIGYDHRGTSIEIDIPFNDNFPKKDAVKCLEGLKKIVDLYRDKVLNPFQISKLENNLNDDMYKKITIQDFVNFTSSQDSHRNVLQGEQKF